MKSSFSSPSSTSRSSAGLPPHRLLPPTTPIPPAQVWNTISPTHQQLVLQTFVTIWLTRLRQPSGDANPKEATDD